MSGAELPAEISLQVAEYCDRNSLKSLRLVCKSFCNSATPLLYSVIHLTPNNRSLNRARNVAASSTLSQQVKDVVFHVGILQDVPNGFLAFRDNIMRLHRPSGEPEEITKDIVWKYNCFLEEMQGQAEFEAQGSARGAWDDLRGPHEPGIHHHGAGLRESL